MDLSRLFAADGRIGRLLVGDGEDRMRQVYGKSSRLCAPAQEKV